MSICTKGSFLLLALLLWISGTGNLSAGPAADSLNLYTPYTKITVPPGQSIDYIVDVINNSKEIKHVGITISGLPRDWNYDLQSGGWNIRQISVLPGERKNLNLKVEVPLRINKGSYRFNIVAEGYDTLPLTVTVSEQGTFKTEFTSSQANMEGHSKSTFTFNAELKNRTAESQLYALMASAPRGWNVTFKANYNAVTSVNTEPNSTQNITIEIKAPEKVEAGRYKIPVTATTSSTSASLELEVVITGSFGMELSTPTGLLSTDITAGDTKRVELVVNNTGSAVLSDISFEFSAPLNWDVTFDPKNIEVLQPGKTDRVYATIKADKKAIPGDYVTNIDAKTPEVSSRAAFRISVETPILWGWIGILIILAALGSVYYLFRKYGRR